MGETRNAYKFFVQSLNGGEHSEDLGVDVKIILKWILRELGWKVVNWIHLAQDRDQYIAVVNMVVNFRVT
jgi:uncharacterized protein YjcR